MKISKIDIIVLVACFVTLSLLIYILCILGKQDDDNYKKCIENYSENYCKKSIYGIY